MNAKSLFAKVFWSRIILAVSSIEFCQEIFDEGDIREGLGGNGGHGAMMPPLQQAIRIMSNILEDQRTN